MILDAKSVRTKRQVYEAYWRSLRIHKESRKIEKPESFFLMLISGESQISAAVAKSGVSPDTESGYAVFDNNSDLELIKGMSGDLFTFESNLDLPDDDPSLDNEIFFSMLKVQLKTGIEK